MRERTSALQLYRHDLVAPLRHVVQQVHDVAPLGPSDPPSASDAALS